MSDTRSIELRTSEILDSSVMRLPFVYIQEQFGYSVESILRPIQGTTMVHMGTYPDTFPNTILEYYWIQEGVPGVSIWMALGKLTTGHYFFYTAQCPATQRTFLDGGHMNLWASVRFSDIIHYAMDAVIYAKYVQETKG
jgi:hypothetical protein